MANSKSAAKRDRQSKVRRMRNKIAKSTLRTAVRRFDTAVASKDSTAAQEELKRVTSLLDKSAGVGVLHKNTAARKKSRLSARFHSIQ